LISGDLSSIDDSYSRTFSLSLMDTGASYFVIINGWGLVSFQKCFKSAIVNFILWGSRFALTQSTNYFIPDGEYYKNCNFFGYLGGVHFVAALLSLTGIKPEILCGLWSAIHEFTQNQIPFFGYLALYYLANTIGFHVSKFHPLWQWCVYLMPIIFCDLEILHPLRETQNIAFCLFCFSSLYLVLVISRSFRMNYSDMSILYRSIDHHPLVFFTLANLATGIVNLTIDANHSGVFIALLAVVWVFSSAGIGTLVIGFVWERR
jgi:hypothetical protein